MDIMFLLSNIYGTNNSSRNRALFEEVEKEMCSFLRLFSSATLILGGDWNSIKEPLLDCRPPRPVRVDKTAEIEQTVKNRSLVDFHSYAERSYGCLY